MDNNYVVINDRRVIVIDVHIEDVDSKADEYVITVNGAHLARLYPHRARRLGIFASRDEDNSRNW